MKNRYSICESYLEINEIRKNVDNEVLMTLYQSLPQDYFFDNVGKLQAIKSDIAWDLQFFKDKVCTYLYISNQHIHFTSAREISEWTLYKGTIEIISDKIIAIIIKKELHNSCIEYTHWCIPSECINVLMREIRLILDS